MKGLPAEMAGDEERQEGKRGIEEKIAQLERMRGSLHDLAAACRAREPSSDCPILEALEQEGSTS